MFVVNEDLSIYATRGDVVFFSVTAESNGENYVFQAGDVVRMTIYGKKDAQTVVMQKDFPVTTATESVEIYLTEQDTRIGEIISKPTDYWYEVELNPFTNPQTIIGYDEDGAKVFKLFPEGRAMDEETEDTEEDIPTVDTDLDFTSPRPVENRAIARAMAQLEAGYEAADEKLTKDVNELENALTERSNSLNGRITAVNAEVVVERARIDNLVASPTPGDSELVDIRVGYDGKTYPTSGSATRAQTSEIVSNMVQAGIYNEVVLNGKDAPGFYVARNSGVYAFVDNPDRGYMTYDVSAYVGKTILVSTMLDISSISVVLFADASGSPISNIPGFTEYYKVAVRVPEGASTLYVNYAAEKVSNNSVSVKYVDVLNVTEAFKDVSASVQRTNEQLSSFVRDGKLPIVLEWELGWIDYTNGVDSAGEFTDRMKTVGYYAPAFDKIHYSIPDGYRFLALRYRYDGTAYTFVDSTGYINGTRSGEIEVNDGDCFRFLFRANPDMALTDEYENLNLYCISGADEDVPVVPKHWTDTISEKEQAIKDIVLNAAKNNEDVALFMVLTDPHYPSNTGVSTALMKYLSDKCGIGLTVCLGDLIMDSTKSREEGFQRIQMGMNHLGKMSERFILTQGNHDTNVQIVDGNRELLADRIIYDKEWILHTYNKMPNLGKVVFDDLRKAFYYDDDLQRIRFIALDSFEGKRYTIVDGVLTDLGLGTVTARQIEWLASVLSTVPAGYGVITFSHYGLYKPYVKNEAGTYVSLPSGGIGNSDNAVAAIKDFVAKGGVYICHFGGHLHQDFVSNKDGLVSVQLLNDGLDLRKADYFGEGYEFVGDSPVKTEGTTTECAFDAVIINKTTRHVDLIRVGAGENRSFDY